MQAADFVRLFAYDRWANHQALESVRAAGSPARSLKLMSHIAAAESLWLERIKGSGKKVIVWPEWTLEQCADELRAAGKEWELYLEKANEQTLATATAYRNTKGEQWTSLVRDIAMHVAMHGVYHRGQVAADVRANGGEPAYTDFIQAVRAGEIASSF
jgi:uncharacterized damage-inducible protein DinB